MLPWATISSDLAVTESTTLIGISQGDGIAVVVCGVATAALALVWLRRDGGPRTGQAIGAMVLSLVAAGIAAINLADVNDLSGVADTGVTVASGPGLYLALFGGLAAVVASVVAAIIASRTRARG